MKFLIDTHCWIWAFGAQKKLNDAALELLCDDENTIYLSAISAAEIGIKTRVGKLKLSDAASKYVASGIEDSGVETLPLYVHHALRVAELPLHHRDPFDRLLVAQALAEGLPLMTADEKLAAYDVEIIWAGRGEAPQRIQ